MVAFPAECATCNRQSNAENFGCGWDDRYRGKGKLTHAWDKDLKTCPRYHLESETDVTEILQDLEDYRRGSLGTVGHLSAPLVDYLRAADSIQRKWGEEAIGG